MQSNPRCSEVRSDAAEADAPEGDGWVPDLVPARMVNEFVYCPRLFHLEWVQARFAENFDTLQGAHVHRVVDEEAGRLPPPEASHELKRARSVRLSSERLGLVAVLDLVEPGPDGTVVPVDYKKGSPADNEHGAHPPERLQLCVQGLLLRDNGYRSDHGYLYFDTTRQRVRIDFDDDLVTETLRVVEELRSVAARGDAPAPLIDSPKCPRCSLAGLCLPDETNVLTGRQQHQVRKLMPSGDDAAPVHVTEPGSVLGKDHGLLTVTLRGERLHEVRLIDVSQLCVYGNVQVSSQLLRELMDRDVPILHFTGAGWFRGITHGMPSKNVDLRIRQAAMVSHGGLPFAREVIAGKISNSRVFLRRNAKRPVTTAVARLAAAARRAQEATGLQELLGIEGAAARTYFGALPSLISDRVELPGDMFSFEGRKRRPPTDAINSLLSFGYSQLTRDLTVTTMVVGFDPYMGFYHRPRYGRPSLALDLAEEFRPLVVDSTVISALNNGELQARHFETRGPAVLLTKDGRRAFLRAYERRMATEVTHPTFGYRITYRRVLEVQARVLAAAMLGEIPDYRAFRTR